MKPVSSDFNTLLSCCYHSCPWSSSPYFANSYLSKHPRLCLTGCVSEANVLSTQAQQTAMDLSRLRCGPTKPLATRSSPKSTARFRIPRASSHSFFGPSRVSYDCPDFPGHRSYKACMLSKLRATHPAKTPNATPGSPTPNPNFCTFPL